jgi:hypothetical protein
MFPGTAVEKVCRVRLRTASLPWPVVRKRTLRKPEWSRRSPRMADQYTHSNKVAVIGRSKCNRRQRRLSLRSTQPT